MNTVKKTTCSDPELEHRISLAVAVNLAQGRELALTPDLQEHIAACESCRSQISTWVEKGKATFLQAQAEKVVQRGRQGEPDVRLKHLPAGTGYFLPDSAAPERGLFVLSGDSSPFDIRRIEEMTLDTFENLSS